MCAQYEITKHSLFAAASMGVDSEKICSKLVTFAKNDVRQELLDWITEQTTRNGKIKLVLKNGEFRIEVADPLLMRKLLKDKKLKECAHYACLCYGIVM